MKRFIDCKAYRAILGYYNVRIRPPRGEEEQHQGEGKRLRVVGYTPLGAGFHSLGEGAAIQSRARGRGLTYISTGDDLEFRVGKVMNSLHKLVTGHKLPFAAMNIQYSFDYDGSYIIDVSSTNIPNITVYLDWVAVADYSICSISGEQVDDFLTAFTDRRSARMEDRFLIEGVVGQEPRITQGGINFRSLW